MPTPLTLRLVKGSTLTFSELDNDLSALRTTADNALSLATTAVQSVNTKTGTNITLTTSDISEGTNLYYLDTRVQSYLTTKYNQPNGIPQLDSSIKLLSTQIPNLPWSIITSGTPTTLAGYGITDAYTMTTSDSLYVHQTGYTAGQINYGQSSGSLATRTLVAGTNITITENVVGATLTIAAPSIPVGSITGTLPIGSGGTNAITASAAFNNLSPITLLGDLIVGSGTTSNSRLAGNITTTKMYLSQIGNGSISALPVWSQISFSDISGTASSGQIPWSTPGTIGSTTPNTGAFTTLSASGVTTLQNGSVGAPSLNFGDSTTGFYRVASAQIGLSFAGANYATFAASAFTLGNTTQSMSVSIQGAASTTRSFKFQTAGVDRWIWQCDSTTESGSNAGSNLNLLSRSDAGGGLVTVLAITRSTGAIAAAGQLSLSANIASTSTTSGTLIVTGGAGFSGSIYTGGSINLTGGTSQLVATQTSTITSGSFQPIISNTVANPASASSATYFGFYADVQTSASCAQNLTGYLAGHAIRSLHFGTGSISTMYGLTAEVDLRVGAGSITEARAIQATISNLGSNNITNGYGVYINSANKSGTGNILTNYGLYVNNQTVGSANYSIYTNTGTVFFGDSVQIGTVGKSLGIKEGTNAKMGTAILAAGTVVVNTTAVAANSRIYLTINTAGGTVGTVYVSARTAGTSFTITSSSNTDTSTVAWVILDPL